MAGIAHAEVEMETQRCERTHLSCLEPDEAELKYLFRTFLTSHPCLWTFDDPVTLSCAGETSCPLLGQGQTY